MLNNNKKIKPLVNNQNSFFTSRLFTGPPYKILLLLFNCADYKF